MYPRTKFKNTYTNTKIVDTSKFIMFDVWSKMNSHANNQEISASQ